MPDYLQYINKNAYLCIVKIQEGHEAAAPNKAAYFVPNAKRNIAATAWASGNTPKGIPLGALTARSAAFLFICQNIKSMKKYQNETDKVVAIARAQAKIAEFLKHEYSYTELMTKTAKAQAQVFNIINLCDVNQREECQVEELAEFFFFAIRAFELLEPFTEDNLSAV